MIRNEIRGSGVGVGQRKTTAVAVEQRPALAVPLRVVGEREALGVSADRDQLVGAGAPGLGRGGPDSPAQRQQRMPARRPAGASLGNGMVAA